MCARGGDLFAQYWCIDVGLRPNVDSLPSEDEVHEQVQEFLLDRSVSQQMAPMLSVGGQSAITAACFCANLSAPKSPQLSAFAIAISTRPKGNRAIVHQKRRNDNINKICAWRGSERGRFEGKLSPKLFFVWENPMTITFENSQILLSEILLSFRRLLV